MSLWSQLDLLGRYRRLHRQGVLGMNCRNTNCILDLNPRARFPYVDGKRRMRDLCHAIGVPTPAIFATLATHSALRYLPRLLAEHDDFVLKPNRGAAGRGIVVVVGRHNGRFRRHDGELLTLDDLHSHASEIISGLFSLGGRSDEVLIQQRVVPDPILNRISYQGTADLRIIIYKNVPVAAMLRLPTRLSGGRANLHQGAIGAGVDLATGITNRAVLRNRVTDRHPDTGESIVGFQVPHWQDILSMACRVSRAVQMGYLGVDIVLDEKQGPLLLEANARPGLAIQIANGFGLRHRFAEIDSSMG